MIDMEWIRQIQVIVEEGTNRFTMSRGSFVYKQKTNKRCPLILSAEESGETSARLYYSDPSGTVCTLDFTSEGDGMYRIALSVTPEKKFLRYTLVLPSDASERFYGCGETYSKFNLKGEKVRIWVAEHQNASRISKKIIRGKIFGPQPKHILPFGEYESYYVQPTYVSSKRYFIHADVTSYCEFDFRKENTTALMFNEEPVLHIGHAESFPELSRKLAGVLGTPKDLPDWIFDGAILAVQEGTARIEEKIARAREAGVPICGIWSQDWCGCSRTGFGYQVMWSWKWDEELYPGLDEKIAEWKEEGIRFLGYINPFMALESDLYREASQKGYCVRDREGKDYLVKITTFPAAMIDFTNPDAYRWYKEVIKTNMIGLGLSGWMADFGEYLPVDCVLYDGSDPYQVHNEWPAIWAKCNREAVEECGKAGEIFFFTRAGFTDTIRQSVMMWTGDQHVDWSLDDGLAAVIPATLSLGLSGYPYAHSDVGGYTTMFQMKRSEELLQRWEEMNAFSPVFRTHEGNQPMNNVQFDDSPALLTQLSRMARAHRNLKHYLKDCIREAQEDGIPVMRPLFYHYDEEPAYDEMFEYLLGRDLLVAPVIEEKAVYREVYLPEDQWIHLYTGDSYDGGRHSVFAPIGRPPVFVRKDSPYADELIQAVRE
ncbi:MAG: alpha-glucosidase [Lachnospiraceae bacterium]|nr:alpha-glucosidase [Lachnospiraceae bacterium]